MANENAPVIIIKKVKKGGHAHHGGAWKIAYADFVTAMMAFFMLLWLLGNTTEEQKQGIADYFSPVSVSAANSGSDGVLGGESLEDEGARSTSASIMVPIEDSTVAPQVRNDQEIQKTADASDEEERERELAEEEQRKFNAVEEELQTTLSDLPDMAGLSDHLVIDQTPEGMRIQIIDRDDRSMFATGEAEPLAHTKALLETLAKIINKLPNRIKISGHTDSTPLSRDGGDYGNWELSSDRAQATRRILRKAEVRPDRFLEVTGRANTEPFDTFDADSPANRRINIVILREAPVLPPSGNN